jgi:hypothetical protein
MRHEAWPASLGFNPRVKGMLETLEIGISMLVMLACSTTNLDIAKFFTIFFLGKAWEQGTK